MRLPPRFKDGKGSLYLHKIGFNSYITGGPLAYSWLYHCIFIGVCDCGDEDLTEKAMEALISHESIHGVLHKLINANVCIEYDNLGEYVGYTPISFPQIRGKPNENQK